MLDTVVPRLQLFIDQEGDNQYTPVFRPGENITGTLKIITEFPLQVLHLRVSFFGHVQLHGDKRETPLTTGIFDYHKNRQLISTGIRIARRPSPVDDYNTAPKAESSKDAMKRLSLSTQCGHRTINKYSTVNNISGISKMSDGSTSTSKDEKSALIKETEALIRLIASKEKLQDTLIHPTLKNFDYPASHVYELTSKHNKLQYRVPIPKSKLLPGTFHHRHCPISYYTIAIMLCKDLDSDTYYVTYAKSPIMFNPQVNVLSATYAGLLRENYRLSLGSDSLIARLLNTTHRYRHRHARPLLFRNYSNPSFTTGKSSSNVPLINNSSDFYSSGCVDNSHGYISKGAISSFSFISDWWCRLVQQHSWIPLDRQGKYDKVLDCTLELPRRAFCRGQALPFSVRLINGAGIRIAMVTIEMKLIRRIMVTCTFEETVATDVEFETASTFYGDEVDVPGLHDNNESVNGTTEQQQQQQENDTLTPPSTPPLKPEEKETTREPFFLFTTREMLFDLSSVAHVPQHCPCTIMSELTRDTFEMTYEWNVKVKVLEAKHGPRLDASLDDRGDHVTKYYATKNRSLDIGVLSSDYRIHVLEPPKMNIVIGNVACKV
ncbi:uncharacterized protein BX664DRAFT_385291 [Halteromyces radiatus]|uniref:uncharacterized protein n=1 Tax=Halteromyces radiatus TaxID=101107 RepID=UPI00221F065B|nr:uncharacterized protein BX664DRAFT_385291 [Halteromyces radiatus]KAI8088672.1 hypothetical protein BX664DRAFT_385291 [Halteromyces radiatus]